MRAGSECAVKTTWASSPDYSAQALRHASREQLDERGLRSPLPDEARLGAAGDRIVEERLVARDGERRPVRGEHEPQERVVTELERGLDRFGDPRLPVPHACEHRDPERALESRTRVLGDRVEGRRRVRVVDAERPVARDQVVEQPRRDRAAASDVRVVVRNVRQPIGRAVRHQDHGRTRHTTTVASVRSRTSSTSRVSASGSVSGSTP